MVNIKINNQSLHKIQMKLEEDEVGASYLSYPLHRIKYGVEKNKVILKIPIKLALELYYSGILPQNKQKAFSLKIKNKKIGLFQVLEIKYKDIFDKEISIILTPIYEKKIVRKRLKK